MNTHDAEHERLLEDLISGRSPRDAAAERRIAACPECARTWRELSELESRLTGAADEEAAILREALATPDKTDATRLVRDFVRNAPPLTPVRRRPRWFVVGTLLAAAAAVLIVLLLRPEEDVHREPDMLLATGAHLSVRYHEPFTGTLEWSFADGGSAPAFELLVFDEDGNRIAFAAPKAGEMRWTWTPEQMSSWPKSVRIEVIAEPLGLDPDVVRFNVSRE
ncbi:MAG: hypothetical protein L6Q99_05375 [Planctomycetes bacterium]|nr:hypothetical protein [Planctomycetota bacterium]